MLMLQLREAEEGRLIQRSAMSTCISLGFLAFAHGAFVGILDLPMFAADAASAVPTNLPITDLQYLTLS